MARRASGFVEWVPACSSAEGHFKSRVRFKKARPWVHLPPWLAEDPARALAAVLARCAREGFALEWAPAALTRAAHWRVLVEYPDGGVVEVDLVGVVDQDAAIARGASLARTARTAPRPSSRSPTTLAKWCEGWIAAKRAKGQTSVKAIESHLRTHVLPALDADRDPREVTRRDLEALVARLDALVSAGELKWKSAINVWGTVTKIFDDMHRGKVLELRVRDDNPARDVRGPDRGVETEKVHLYPSEFVALVTCAAVPLERRRYYAIAIYNYLRPAELEALRWEDIDLERGTIQIRRGMDRDRDVEKAPKAGRARLPFDLEPQIVPLLEAMRRESDGTGRVVGYMGDERALAEKLRADLLAAGVTRRELHEGSDDPPREWMTMHDCRTTGITWMAVRGDAPLVIMARAGHADLKQTQGYIDRAVLIRRGYGAPFPPLPATLLDQRRTTAARMPRIPRRISGSAWESNPPAAP